MPRRVVASGDSYPDELIDSVIELLEESSASGASLEQIAGVISDRFRRSFTVVDLYNLFGRQEFRARWPHSDRPFMPTRDLASGHYAGLLMPAMSAMKSMLESSDTPATVKWRIIEHIEDMNAVERNEQTGSVLDEFVQFLARRGGDIDMRLSDLANAVIPAEYREAEEAVLHPTPENNLVGGGEVR